MAGASDLNRERPDPGVELVPALGRQVKRRPALTLLRPRTDRSDVSPAKPAEDRRSLDLLSAVQTSLHDRSMPASIGPSGGRQQSCDRVDRHSWVTGLFEGANQVRAAAPAGSAAPVAVATRRSSS